MKVQYLILLVVVVLEAGLSLWPAVAAADDTVIVKPAGRKGKSPKKIRRTIRVREAAPAPGQAPVQPIPQQQPAAQQPINNEVNVKPDISVQVSPQQQQQHHPNQQQPLVHIQTPAEPQPQQQIVVPQQQQPIVELPDDDEQDDDDDHSVRAENMQIVPYEQPEQSIVPVNQPDANEEEEPSNQLQIVPRSNRATELVDMGSEQVKRMLLRAGDLMPQFFARDPNTGALVPSSPFNVGAPHQQLLDPNNTHNNLHANDFNRPRYNPLGWPAVAGYPASFAAAAATPFAVAPIAGQMPVIQMSVDEQVRGQPWSFGQPAAYAPLSATPYVGASATPIWQQPAASFVAASPVGAAMTAAPLYQAAAPAMGFRGYPAMMPMVQSTAPAMMMPPMATVQQVPTMMMQPAFMMPTAIFSPPAEMKIRKKKSKKSKKPKKQVVVQEIEQEPVVEEKTTWVKKEPQFNQYVEQPATKTVVTTEVKKPQQQVVVQEQPEEIEWETVRIPKIKKNDATAAGQQ